MSASASELVEHNLSLLYKEIFTLTQEMKRVQAASSFVDKAQRSLLRIMRNVHVCEAEKCINLAIFSGAMQATFNEVFQQAIALPSTVVAIDLSNYSKDIDDSKKTLRTWLTEKPKKLAEKPWLKQRKLAADKPKAGLKIPAADEQGNVKTLNGKGHMVKLFDQATRDFIQIHAEESKDPKYRILILGAAYGQVPLELLKKNKNATIIVNDLSPKHLAIFRSRVPKASRRVTTIAGAIPAELHFPDSYFDAILIRNMAHFLTDEELNTALALCHTWLKDGGQLQIQSASVHIGVMSSLQDVYQSNKSNKQAWPGYFPKFRQLVKEKKSLSPEQAEFVPETCLLMSRKQLTRHLRSARFTVQDGATRYIDAPEYFPKLFINNGREYVTSQASKDPGPKC